MSEGRTTEHLIALAKDLYEEGCMSGIGPNKAVWYSAWAEAMRRVTHGEPYTIELVRDIFHEQQRAEQ